MSQKIQFISRKSHAASWLLLLWFSCFFSQAEGQQIRSEPPFANNISDLRYAISPRSGRICAYNLEGTILAVNNSLATIFLQDTSGISALEVNLKGQLFQRGQRIRLSGTNYVSHTEIGLSLGTCPVIDADNLHSTITRFGDIYLKPGLTPIKVNWFNKSGTYALNLAYEGPQIPRQTIPNLDLFQEGEQLENAIGLTGLRYRCFEGQWNKLPDFSSLEPKKVGTVSNFDISVKSRDENVGLEFKGFLNVPKEGVYRFYLSSDDGSQLFLSDTPPKVSVISTVPIPAAQPIVIGQPLPSNQNAFWAVAHGTITFLSSYEGRVTFELSSGENRMQVEVLGAADGIPWYLLNSEVSVRGICQDMRNAEEQKFAGSIVVANWQDVNVLGVASGQWSAFGSATIGELGQENQKDNGGIACLHGRIEYDPIRQRMMFKDATGSASIDLLTGALPDTNSEIGCLTKWIRIGTNVLLSEAVISKVQTEFGVGSNALPLLKTAIQVQQLTREEALRDYPVKIRGVVTSVSEDFRSFMIQDSTRAVFAWVGDESPANLPHQGDYCEVEGTSAPLDFSPIVLLRKATVLWKGQMPQPISPSRDQLLSGSLDAQYVEIRGLVIATQDSNMTLLTEDGILNLEVIPVPDGEWKGFINSIIRVRGCLVANWDPPTHRVIIDPLIHLNIKNATVSVEYPPPADMFAADTVRAKDLMQFDARFDTFRRVKVYGQIIHCGSDMNYLMDGSTGLSFRLVEPMRFDAGDEVEVVGLVELGGASPVLRQAVARKIGHRSLPEPQNLSVNSLSNQFDSTLVSLEGILIDIQNQGSRQVLQMQVGVRSFLALLDYDKQLPTPSWAIGSRLKLTGTFCALDVDRLAGRDVNSFEILLNSPTDVQVIAKPPWWTLTRLLVAIACLLAGLTLAFIWINLLRHQVDRRTQQLGREITERERAEKLRAIEHERSRIARDLHDDLGSKLTEISMMATATPGKKLGSEVAFDRLSEIAEKSRSMVSALDGVVWVINSKNDTLSSLLEYLASFGEEFLAKTGVAYRVEFPKEYTDRPIAGEIRHDVILAAREAMNNAVRHGRSKEVLLRLSIAGADLEILVQDNGCGFDPLQANGNGLANLEERMHKLNGSCHIESTADVGTSIRLKLTLPQ